MCRLFAFHSVITSQVHSSLVEADNTLHDLSEKHPDGWGVGYYVEGTPHLIRSTNCAMDDQLFHKVSGVVSSNTVLAHIRKATQGNQTILNSHPFQYGKWIFAHNGNIKDFAKKKDELLKLIDLDLKRYILGTTDSEVLFYILLSHIKKHHSLKDHHIPLEKMKLYINEALAEVTAITGLPTHRNDPTPTENYFSFILTNGKKIIAVNGGQDLFFCTYKTICPERDHCPFHAENCEAPPSEDGLVNHLILSSEKLSGVNVWKKIEAGQMVGVDTEMKFYQSKLDLLFEK